MSTKLEELRKRFLPPTSDVAPDAASDQGAQVSELANSDARPSPAYSAESAESGHAQTAESSSQTESLAERLSGNREKESVCDDAKSVNELALAIDKLFEPTQRCTQRFAEITKASDALLELAGSASGLFESLGDFRDHMRRLSNSFASMRAFQDDLGVLAESFEPLKALHHEIGQLADAIRARLGEVSSSLEAANTLRAQAAKLVQILEGATALKTEFFELSKTFATGQANGTSTKGGRDERASSASRWRLI